MINEEHDDRNDLEFLVDHEEITTEQQKIAEDILETIIKGQSDNLPLKYTISQIKNSYKLEETPMVDVSSSLWYEFTKNEKIGANIQGYRTIEKDGKKVRIPHISFSADLDYLDEMIRRLITRINNLKKK